MAREKKPEARKSSLDPLDLRDSNVVIKVNGEVEVSKIVTWDNTNGQRGVIKASYLNIVVRGEKGTQKFVVGCKEGNIWLGKEIANAKAEAKQQVIEV